MTSDVIRYYLRFVLHFVAAGFVFGFICFICIDYLIPWIRKVLKRDHRSN